MLKLQHTLSLISHASKVLLNILQARLQQYMNHELPDVQAGFSKGRETDYHVVITWLNGADHVTDHALIMFAIIHWSCASGGNEHRAE